MMQNKKIPIPLSLAKDLSCGQCQNVVSCGPVYVVPSNDAILCGRCQYLAMDVYQNKAYEALASMFLFPCRYWNYYCSRFLTWNGCFQHEEQCSHSSCCRRFWLHPKTLFRGERDIPYGDIRLLPVPDHLLDFIRCAACQLYLTCEPVYLQQNGSNICHRCISNNGPPPYGLRNHSYEQLSSIIIFPCVFRNRGCPTRLKFGRDLWEHESKCSYNQMFKKTVSKTGKKEKGVILTHSGHYYGTITPNSAAFAPPTSNTEFDINKQLLKSLKKQQERKFLRAEEINSNIRKINSEDGSSSDEDVDRATSSDKSSLGVPSTPTRVDEPDPRGKLNNPQHLSSRDSGYYSNDITRANSENFHQNINTLTPVHQDADARSSRNNSNNQQYIPDFLSKSNMLPERAQDLKMRSSVYSDNGYPISEGIHTKASRSMPLLDYSLLAGHYPIFSNKSDLQYRPSFSGSGIVPPKTNLHLARTDSLSSNRDLMNELKRRQSFMKNKRLIERSEEISPYRECHSLDDVLQVHDKISH